MNYKKLSRVCDSVKRVSSVQVADSISPQMEELIEAFMDMDDTDNIEVEVSAPIPQEEIDDFVKRYMEHNPEGEEEFKFTIESLGDNKYKVSCPYVLEDYEDEED